MIRKKISHFSELKIEELYEIIKLRLQVFVLEQRCCYQDADDKDKKCHHLSYWEGDRLIAYARLLPPDDKFPDSSIGRIVVDEKYRGKGIATKLLDDACDFLFEKHPHNTIRVGAQVHLKGFYKKCGFKKDGKEYVEDRIVHLHMIKNPVIDEKIK